MPAAPQAEVDPTALSGAHAVDSGAAGELVVVIQREHEPGEPEPLAGTAEAAPEPCSLDEVPQCWQPLAWRLAADGVEPALISSLFCALGPELPQLAMGTKVNELYKAKYLRRAAPTPSTPRPAPSSPPVYKGMVTNANAALCREFLAEHAEVFARAKAEYGVPQNIAAALLFVETRLGLQVGKHQAVRNLAGMAAAHAPEHVPDYIGKLEGLNAERLQWLSGRMREKADWAYAELKALLGYAKGLDRNLLEIPGSVYGAIGLCQFMPSNVGPYAKDGNGDGIIDLHCVDDAVMSMAHYLSRHGWKKSGMTKESIRKALMRYNNSTVYANTIMALAERIGTTSAGK